MFKQIPWKSPWPRRVTPRQLSAVTYIGLGTNLGTAGQRLRRLQLALLTLQRLSPIRIIAVSSIFETPPWGDTDQPAFYNCVAAIHCPLAPQHLLRLLKQIEQTLGRQHRRRWGPREIDLDILTIPHRRLDHPGLTIPHKSMHQRPFVLVPLQEVSGFQTLQSDVTFHR